MGPPGRGLRPPPESEGAHCSRPRSTPPKPRFGACLQCRENRRLLPRFPENRLPGLVDRPAWQTGLPAPHGQGLAACCARRDAEVVAGRCEAFWRDKRRRLTTNPIRIGRGAPAGQPGRIGARWLPTAGMSRVEAGSCRRPKARGGAAKVGQMSGWPWWRDHAHCPKGAAGRIQDGATASWGAG